VTAASPLKVVFLNRFYWPDLAATAQMLTDLAEDLAAMGWSVTVIANDSPYDGSGDRLPHEESRNDVRILRVGGTNFGRHGLMGRVGAYASYMFGSLRQVMMLPPQDVVVAMSDPPLLIALAVLIARLRGWRCVYWVQDLFPQIAAELGVLARRGLVYRLTERFSRALNRTCDLTIALCPRMAERMTAAGVRKERIAFVHNWADTTAIRPIDPADNPFVAAHGLLGKFVVLYSGNAGRAHRFDGVLEAARLLRDDPDVIFLFIGGGKRLPEIRMAVADAQLRNVRFLDYLPREELAFSLSAASLSLVTEEESVNGLLVPSKTYGILASGRPIAFLGSGASDAATVVREANSGFVLPPGDGEQLSRIIRRLRDNARLGSELGDNGRQAATAFYGRKVSTTRWADLVSAAVRP